MKPHLILKMRRLVLLGIIATSAAAAGCGSESSDTAAPDVPIEAACPALGYFPIVVTVIDAVTRQPVANATGRAWYEDMTTAELVTRDGRLVSTLPPKSGLYAVLIQASGYEDWTQDRIPSPPPVTAEAPCPGSVEMVAELVLEA